MSRILLLFLTVGLLAACACSRGPKFETQVLGDREVSGKVLKVGWRTYESECSSCHGMAGDGKGPEGEGLRPRPTDFTQGTFKFGWVTGGLPRDEDLERMVTGGVHEPMVAFDLEDDELNGVIQYLKLFSPAWKTENSVGAPVVPAPDPWEAEERTVAIARGNVVYHGLAQCWTCHPAYETRAAISAAAFQMSGQPMGELRAELHLGVPLVASAESSAKDSLARTPDFMFHRLRSMRPGVEAQDLYRVIAAGLPGTTMQPIGDALTPKDLWALAHYVHDLAKLRGSDGAQQLHERLERAEKRAVPVAR